MTVDEVMQIGNQALWTAMLLAAPILLTALAVGLLVGVVQAATQIQEMTLSFIPKLLGVIAVLVVCGQSMLSLAMNWFRELVTSIPALLS